MEKQRLQRQLTTEQHWKQLSIERITKLEEELQHMLQEQQGAELRLSTQRNPLQQNSVLNNSQWQEQ